MPRCSVLMFLLEPVSETGPNEVATYTQLLGKLDSSQMFFFLSKPANPVFIP